METFNSASLEPVFDWYQFSSHTNINLLREVLSPIAAEEPFREEKPKLKGYAWAAKVGGQGGSVLVHYGGKNGDDHGPNVAATGPIAPRVAGLVREANMPHGVSRADVKIDFLGDFESCRLKFIERADRAGMKPRDEGSCPESVNQDGRSVYCGAQGSFYRGVMYEKGRQLRGLGIPDAPVELLRLEHRFVPSKAHEKQELSSLSPVQMVGLRPVARDLSTLIAQMAVAPYRITKFPRERNVYFAMLKQYQNTLWGLLDDHGSPAAVGEQLFFDLEEMKQRA